MISRFKASRLHKKTGIAALAAKIPALQDVLSIAGVAAAGQEKFAFFALNAGRWPDGQNMGSRRKYF